MNRDAALREIGKRTSPWDLVVIGGGATGLGVAVDAAARGYATLLLEQADFAKGTSSRSTKIIHGGIRYLAQGRIGLVRTALHERDLLLRNAPHLVHDLQFVIPAYSLWELPFYFSGLKAYDLLAGRFSRGRTTWLSAATMRNSFPNLQPAGLKGGISYHDGQFDDARLALSLARTLSLHGGTAVNYVRVSGLIKSNGRVSGVSACDLESGNGLEIAARVVINATGAFADDVLRFDDSHAERSVTPSQGIHIVLDSNVLPGKQAIVVPHTDDNRVLFAIPWHGRVLLGTTDTPVPRADLEPRAQEAELDFLLANAGRYLAQAPRRDQIFSIFAGLRPLAIDHHAKSTAAASRDHHIEVSASGLVTITGGKWTTYRHMAEEVVDRAAIVGGLSHRKCTTHQLRLHGWRTDLDPADPLTVYGSESPAIRKLVEKEPRLAEKIHPRLPYLLGEVVWGARYEMGRTVEDILARRTRSLLIDARASAEATPAVAKLLAAELNQSDEWQSHQVSEFQKLAAGYLPG